LEWSGLGMEWFLWYTVRIQLAKVNDLFSSQAFRSPVILS
jgi:hypothetical protein